MPRTSLRGLFLLPLYLGTEAQCLLGTESHFRGHPVPDTPERMSKCLPSVQQAGRKQCESTREKLEFAPDKLLRLCPAFPSPDCFALYVCASSPADCSIRHFGSIQLSTAPEEIFAMLPIPLFSPAAIYDALNEAFRQGVCGTEGSSAAPAVACDHGLTVLAR